MGNSRTPTAGGACWPPRLVQNIINVESRRISLNVAVIVTQSSHSGAKRRSDRARRGYSSIPVSGGSPGTGKPRSVGASGHKGDDASSTGSSHSIKPHAPGRRRGTPLFRLLRLSAVTPVIKEAPDARRSLRFLQGRGRGAYGRGSESWTERRAGAASRASRCRFEFPVRTGCTGGPRLPGDRCLRYFRGTTKSGVQNRTPFRYTPRLQRSARHVSILR